jgi:alpha-D-ribose 1-methylphosphonate 5-triphosphate synthase subunit PhnH
MSGLAAGFSNPVFDSQSAFRSVMNAMARPGRIKTIGLGLEPPAPLSLAAAAACLALADFETPLWLSPALANASGVAQYLSFHTGAGMVRSPEQAAFALVDIRLDPLDLASFAQGVAEYPDRGATVILICASMPAAPHMRIVGPGLRGEGSFGLEPLPSSFAEQWRSNRDAFPLGVDLIVTAGDRIACLPRSTHVLREAA